MTNKTFKGQLFDFVNPAWKDTVDVILFVGGNTIGTNSELLSRMSLEFRQDLSRPTNFMKPVFIEIEGFSTKTVQTAIEFCYMKRSETLKCDLETAFELFLLGKKFNMKQFSEVLAFEVVNSMITERNFLIFSYRALEINSHPLDDELVWYYHENKGYYPENDAIAKITQRLYVAGFEYGDSWEEAFCKCVLYTVGLISFFPLGAFFTGSSIGKPNQCFIDTILGMWRCPKGDKPPPQ